MTTAHILHGIHVTDPSGSVGKLKPYFEEVGFEQVIVHSYGYIFALSILPNAARWKNPKIVEKILPQIEDGDIVVGHSNGGTVAWMLAERGAPFCGAVLINPALDADAALAPQVKWAQVYHNEGDGVVWWSKFLISHPWGEQGRVGYTGSRKGYTNFDTKTENPPATGHLGIFTKENFPIWAPRIASRAWISHLNHSEK